MTSTCVVLVREERRSGRSLNTKVADQAKKVKGVVDAFPALGRADTVVFIEGRSVEECANAALKLHAIPGIRTSETLLSPP